MKAEIRKTYNGAEIRSDIDWKQRYYETAQKVLSALIANATFMSGVAKEASKKQLLEEKDKDAWMREDIVNTTMEITDVFMAKIRSRQ